MATSFSTGWQTLKTYYSQVRFEGWVNWRSGSQVNITIRCHSMGIQNAWWASNHHVYFSVSTSRGGSASVDIGEQWNSGQDYHKDVSFTLNVGYAAGSATCYYTATQSWNGTSSASNSASISWNATYTTPAAPTITSYTSSNGYQESLGYNTNSTAQALVNRTDIERALITSDTATPGWAAQASSVTANPWTNTGSKNASVISRRVLTVSASGASQRSGTTLLLQAPTDPSGFTAKESTTFGASFSWTNNNAMTDYYTYIYEGIVTVGTDGKPVTTDATQIARLNPGVTSYTNQSLWSETGGYTTKTFSLVQVSSYAAWNRTNKSDFCTANYTLDGFASSVLKVTLSNGAVAPEPAYNCSLSNVTDTSFTVTFSCYAPTASKPRTGFRIYANNSLVSTITNVSGASTNLTYSLQWPSNIKGTTATVYIQAYGSGGSSNTSNMVAYGTLYAPNTPTGTRHADSLTAAAKNSSNNRYSSTVLLEYSTDGNTWVSFNGALTAQYIEYKVRARVYSSLSGFYSDYSPILTLESPALPFSWFRSEQDNNYNDQDVTKLVLSWSIPVTDSAVPTSFRITNNVNSDVWTVNYVSGQTNYTYAADWYEIANTTFSIVAVNDWENNPITVEYQYQPPHIKAPVLLTVQKSPEDPTKAILAFQPSTDGAPWTDDGTYYKYRIYVNGVAAIDWTIGKPDFGTVVFMETALSSKSNTFRIGAIDQQGSTSELSNTLYYAFEAVDTGVYIYQCEDFSIEECIIEGKNTLRLEDSTVVMTNSTITYEDKPYIMSTNSSYREIGCVVDGK